MFYSFFMGKKDKKFIGLTVAVVIVLIILLSSGIRTYAKTEKEVNSHKYYTSIKLEAGDSLWSIAEDYVDGSAKDKKSYIKDLCKLNHISENDTVHTGQYLMVYYYSEEEK